VSKSKIRCPIRETPDMRTPRDSYLDPNHPYGIVFKEMMRRIRAMRDLRHEYLIGHGDINKDLQNALETARRARRLSRGNN
jgi:hypothetical protein